MSVVVDATSLGIKEPVVVKTTRANILLGAEFLRDFSKLIEDSQKVDGSNVADTYASLEAIFTEVDNFCQQVLGFDGAQLKALDDMDYMESTLAVNAIILQMLAVDTSHQKSESGPSRD